MSKRVKNLLRKEIVERLEGVKDLAVVGLIGIDAITTNKLRGQLREKGIHVVVVKNAMARQAFKELGMASAVGLLDGACALAYGGESLVDVVREVLDKGKTIPKLAVKGAFLEGEVFGPERVEELSKYPTRIEALGNLSRMITTPGAKVVGAVVGSGALLAGLLKTIEERAEKAAPEAEAAPVAEATPETPAAPETPA